MRERPNICYIFGKLGVQGCQISPCVPVTLSVTFLVSQAPLNREVKIGIIWAVWFFRFATEYSGGHKRWLYFFRGAWKMQNIIPGGFYFANIFSGGRDKKFRGAWSMFLDIQGGSFQVEEKAPLNIYSQRAYIHCQRHNGPRMAGMRSPSPRWRSWHLLWLATLVRLRRRSLAKWPSPLPLLSPPLKGNSRLLLNRAPNLMWQGQFSGLLL